MRDFLTERQKQILDFVGDFLRENGVAPTHLEIRHKFGYRSYGTVHKHLKLLREKGYLRGGWNQKRGLQLTHKARRRASALAREAARAAAEREASILDTSPGGAPTGGRLPCHGRIAAGRPIEAIPGVDDLQVPQHLLGGAAAGRHYVLQVEGDSMIDDGIRDGDMVVIAECDEVQAGQIVVALIDDEEATLKRYYPEGDEVRLQPANRRMQPITVAPHRLRIQGVVAGLMRRY